MVSGRHSYLAVAGDSSAVFSRTAFVFGRVCDGVSGTVSPCSLGIEWRYRLRVLRQSWIFDSVHVAPPRAWRWLCGLHQFNQRCGQLNGDDSAIRALFLTYPLVRLNNMFMFVGTALPSAFPQHWWNRPGGTLFSCAFVRSLMPFHAEPNDGAA